MLHLMVEVAKLDRIRNNHIMVSLTIWEIEHILRGDDVYIARKIRQIHGTRWERRQLEIRGKRRSANPKHLRKISSKGPKEIRCGID